MLELAGCESMQELSAPYNAFATLPSGLPSLPLLATVADARFFALRERLTTPAAAAAPTAAVSAGAGAAGHAPPRGGCDGASEGVEPGNCYFEEVEEGEEAQPQPVAGQGQRPRPEEGQAQPQPRSRQASGPGPARA